MNRFLTYTLILLTLSCGQQKDKQAIDNTTIPIDLGEKKVEEIKNEVHEDSSKNKKLSFSNEHSLGSIKLSRPTVIIIELDSLEIEQVKLIDGEDRFYTASDDLMWYNSLLMKKMDSLNIPIKYTDKDTVKIHSTNFRKTIIKDSTFSLYTYFFFDGKKIEKRELFDLIGE